MSNFYEFFDSEVESVKEIGIDDEMYVNFVSLNISEFFELESDIDEYDFFIILIFGKLDLSKWCELMILSEVVISLWFKICKRKIE